MKFLSGIFTHSVVYINYPNIDCLDQSTKIELESSSLKWNWNRCLRTSLCFEDKYHQSYVESRHRLNVLIYILLIWYKKCLVWCVKNNHCCSKVSPHNNLCHRLSQKKTLTYCFLSKICLLNDNSKFMSTQLLRP